MYAAVGLAIGLAMDATAVAAARGLLRRPGEVVLLPLLFGAFQAGMAALGWGLGAWAGPYIAAWDHWVAFALLVAIGGKMIHTALTGGEDTGAGRPTSAAMYLGLALATSIDAAAAGLALPLLAVSPAVSLSLIGGITVLASAIGYLAGRAAGDRFGSKLELLGGVVLIAIAVRLLIEHL